MKKYYLKYGDSYITRNRNNSFSLTTRKEQAVSYLEKDRKKIENIKKTLPKLYKKSGLTICYEDVPDDSLLKSSDIIKCGVDSDDDLRKKINSISQDFKEIMESKDDLLKQLSHIDLQICDELHYIEMYKFSASEGYKICKAIQKLRDERRVVKNKLELVNALSSQTCVSIANGGLENAINGINNKKYRPRVLNELFEGNDKRKREQYL